MRYILTRAKFFASLLATLYFAIAGVILISVYFTSETMSRYIQERLIYEQIVWLVVGIVHLILVIPAVIAFWLAAKMFGNYMSDSDPWVSASG